MKQRQWFCRIMFYVIGVLCLAVGLTLGNMGRFGTTPINSIPLSLVGAFGMNYPVAVFVYYAVLIILQFLIRGKHRRWRDLAQLPFSAVFSMLLDVCARLIVLDPQAMWQRVLLLAASIVIIGVGVAMTVSMQIVPNPADGMLETISWASGKEMGLMKNLLDGSCVVTAFLIDVLFGTIWSSIGLGTVAAMIFIGRVIFLFNRLFRGKLLRLAGLESMGKK